MGSIDISTKAYMDIYKSIRPVEITVEIKPICRQIKQKLIHSGHI